MEHSQRRKFEFGIVDKIVLFGMLAVLVVLIVLNVLARLNLQLIYGELYMFGTLLIPIALVAWGFYRLIRRMKERRTKLIVGSVLGLVLMLVFTVVMSYFSVIASMSIPQKFGTVVSPSGAHKLVVLRGFDLDEERLEARRASRLAEDPEGDPETLAEDYSYRYLAFPPVLGIFYRSDVQYEGDIVMGFSSPATLMVEWQANETVAHFYVDNPGVGDGGELFVTVASQQE